MNFEAKNELIVIQEYSIVEAFIKNTTQQCYINC